MKKDNKRTISKEEQALVESLKKQVPVIPITVTANLDTTELFATPKNIEDIIRFYCIENATPIILEIYVSSTNNMKETPDNYICRHSYPIIPPVYDLFAKDMSDFITSTPEETQKLIAKKSQKSLQLNISGYAEILYNTILHNLAKRHLQAKTTIEEKTTPSRKREKESKIKEQLENLAIFKNNQFDFTLFEQIATGKIKENKENNSYVLRIKKGKTIPIPYRYQKSTSEYMKHYKSFKDTTAENGLLNRHFQALEQYSQYEVGLFSDGAPSLD